MIFYAVVSIFFSNISGFNLNFMIFYDFVPSGSTDSCPRNKLVIGWLFAQLTINWDELFLNFKLPSSFRLGQYLFRNNLSQLIGNCTHNHPITTTNFTRKKILSRFRMNHFCMESYDLYIYKYKYINNRIFLIS